VIPFYSSLKHVHNEISDVTLQGYCMILACIDADMR